jgi:DNA polymerase-3 subunit delta'
MPFRDVVGHVRLVDLLSRSIAGGTLPPSLLFAGPAGVGKHLMALAVAQALNCLRAGHRAQGSGIDACGTCAACTRIARGVHPDVLFVTPGDNGSIKIEQVLDVVGRAHYRPFEGRRRVVIIDEADALTSSAQNALLKTLEEPPSLSVFILVSAKADSLLPTVLSRCPQLRFRSLSTDEIARALIARGHGESEARSVAATADGSLSHAMQASAEDVVLSRDLARKVLTQVAARPEPARRIDSAKDLLTKPPSGVTEREQMATHLRAMSVLLRDVEVLATGADASLLANPDIRGELEPLVECYDGERGTQAYAAVDRALLAITRNVSVKLVADWLVLQL